MSSGLNTRRREGKDKARRRFVEGAAMTRIATIVMVLAGTLVFLLPGNGLLPASVAQAQTFEPDTDRPGIDYRSFDLPSPSPQLCQQQCYNEPVCRAWTYVRPGLQGPFARCWLKNGIPPAAPSDCCTSGVMRGDAELFRFNSPTVQGAIVDWCATWATDCGAGGAEQFCQQQGYSRAVDWGTFRPGRTWVIGSNQLCEGEVCVGFSH